MLLAGTAQPDYRRQVAIYADGWIVGAMASALILRLINLGTAAFWLDETFTVNWIQLPWIEMMRAVLADNHLPLYPALMKVWAGAAGVSTWGVRLPSVIFSSAMVPVIAAIAWTLLSRVQARWAAWLTALSPYLVQHAQDARMYALTGLLSAIAALLLARFIAGRSQRLGIWFVVVNLALVATHYYGVFLVAAQGLVLLTLRRAQWRLWMYEMAASCAGTMLSLLAAKYLATPHAGGHYDIGWFALPGVLWALIGGDTLVPSSAELHAEGLHAAARYLPIALTAGAALLVIGLSALRSISRDVLWFGVLVLGMVVLSPFIVASFYDVAINPRYAMGAMPALLVLLAAGCARAAESRSQLIAPVILIVCMVIGSSRQVQNPGHAREDVYGAARWLNANVQEQEEILITSDEMAILGRFHWPNRHFVLYPPKKVIADKGNAEQLAADLPFPTGHRVIYIFGREWESDPDGALRAALRARYDACPGTIVRGIQMLCFRKSH